MDKKRTYLIWLTMTAFIAMIAYLFGAAWYWALATGVLCVAALVGTATGVMYWKRKKLFDNAARFNIDLKNGRLHPADLRRMYFSGGQARKDALLIASQAMQCSVAEAEKQLSAKVSKQAVNQEIAHQQSQMRAKSKRRQPRPR